jgi:hypothetical protein
MKLNHRNDSWEHHMLVRYSYLACVLLLTIMSWGPGGTPGYGISPGIEQDRKEAQDLIYQSAQATEKAWEEFHSAAIGGTLASPMVQSGIERQLHEARALLMEARKAERVHQLDSVKSLTQKIVQITQNIVQASREKKQ